MAKRKPKKKSGNTPTITLRGNEIPIDRQMVLHESLKFNPENPRVYSLVQKEGREPDQEEIARTLQSMEHVKILIQSIRANGGVTDPLLVRGGDLVVLEGNSRLAAHRALAAMDPVKWGRVKCDIVPASIDDDDVLALLIQYHIIGRKDWDPYQQAGLFWRQTQDGRTPKQIASEMEGMGVSSKRVRHMVEVYAFMVKNKDTSPNRWSYYDEYLKSRFIGKARKANPRMDRKVAKEIKTGKIKRAVDVRKKLNKVAKTGGKVLQSYLKGKADLDTCAERAEVSGVDNQFLQKLRRFNGMMEDINNRYLGKMPANQRKKCYFELSRVLKKVERCRDFLEE